MLRDVNRESAFSYTCNACGLCCHGKVITLSPYDLLRMARACGITTGEAIRRFTIRRGSILKFNAANACVALAGLRCSLHTGRPLACRLYPLGLERASGAERFVRLGAAAGSAGVYGETATIGAFLAEQETAPYLAAIERYATLLPKLRARVAALVDFERIEPREFWRIAVREATAESGFDPNPLIDALFDLDSFGCGGGGEERAIAAHLRAIEEMALQEREAIAIAAAAVMLAISLGYSPADAIEEAEQSSAHSK